MSADALARVAEVARSWEAACRSTVPDRIVEHLSEDAVVWYNFDKERWHSRSAYKAILEESLKSFWDQQYEDVRITVHAGGFIEQATISGTTPIGTVQASFLLVAEVSGDQITKIEEYIDTGNAQAGKHDDD